MPEVILVITIFIVLVSVSFYRAYITSGVSKLNAESKQDGIDFLALNRFKEGVKVTESGLQYTVLHEGTGSIHPKAKDEVKVNYEGTFIDGRIFDSSIKRGRPAKFGLNNVIKGWTEGLQLMVIGEKVRFFVPAGLGYGNRWTGSIPPGSTLIFDVELLAINE
jgi:peptidylprolyl isomerase